MLWLRGVITAGIRNPVYANMLMVCLLAGGLASGMALVNETYPEFSLDRIAVETVYPGASPEEVEQGVCLKIEEALEGLAGIKKIWSRATENCGLTMVELDSSATDPQTMILSIRDRVEQITSFPPDVEKTITHEVLVRSQVINVAIYGDVPERTLKELAVEAKNELLAYDEVSQINLAGVRNYEIAIQVSEEALLQYDLSLEEIAALVAQNCVDVPAGTLKTQREELTLRTKGQKYSAQEFEDLVIIANPDGTLVTLGQIAQVTDGFEDDVKFGHFQGSPAAILEVYKTTNQDTSTIAGIVRDYVAKKQREIPKKLGISTWADSSREVDARISMLLENGILGMLLVVLILSLFLDFRVSLYVALGIPVSFAGSLIVMHLTGQTLNMITLFGLIMVTGIIVDDAIVIADGFRSRVAAGDPPTLAAASGTSHVALPVFASSVTTVLAFSPLLFVVGIMGKFIAVLPVVVIAAILFSTVESFCILPSHLQHCLGHHEKRGKLIQLMDSLRKSIDERVEWFIREVYSPIFKKALDNRGVTVCVATACLILGLGLIVGRRVPFTLLPDIDGDILMARVRFSPGVPAYKTQAAVDQLEFAANRLNNKNIIDYAGADNLVIQKFSIVGEWSGWIDETGSHLCEVMIELLPSEKRKVSGDEVLEAWQKETGTIPDAVAVTFGRMQKGPTEKPVEVRLLSNDLQELQAASDFVATKLKEFAGVSGIETDLHAGKREIRVKLNRLARTLGITVDDLAKHLRSGFFGGEAVRIQRGRDEVRVQVRYPDDQRKSITDIENIRIKSAVGDGIPFLELADYSIQRGYSSIYRQDGKRRVRILADVDERRTNAERVLADLNDRCLKTLLEKYPNVSYRLEGQHSQMLESLHSLFVGFVIACILSYGILASMLLSYHKPIIIMTAIPLGFVGAIAGHAITGYDLTIMSVFGMVAISGVVVNDSLVLLDEITHGIREDKSVYDAVEQAGKIRFRAVILTTITTVAGLAPLLLERSTQAQSLIPMAISLTFGLIFATLLTLLVVPSLYLLVNDAHRLIRWLRCGGDYPSAEDVEPLVRR